MARKKKELERREGWYHVVGKSKSPGSKGWNETLNLTYGGLDFDSLRTELDWIEQEYAAEFEKFKVEVASEILPYDNEPTITCYVYGWRKETDDEYADRLATEARWAADREEGERKLYERLAKKFGETE